MGFINLIQEIDELKKLLSYSKNIGFFFGAGTSCAFGVHSTQIYINYVENNENVYLIRDGEKIAFKDIALEHEINV